MGLSELIANAAQSYPEAKTGTFTGAAIGRDFKDKIPNALKQATNLDDFIVKGSIGNGNFADVPWIAIMDRDITSSTTKGVYIVFLFSSDGKRVYLSFNQGVTYFREQKIADQDVRTISRKIGEKCPTSDSVVNHIDLSASTALAKGYEKTNIYSYEYHTDNMPSDEAIIENLESLVSKYRDLKVAFVEAGSSIEAFYSSFDMTKAPNKYVIFKQLLRRFIELANINLNPNTEKSDRKATIGGQGFEANQYERVTGVGQGNDKVTIDGTQHTVYLFKSGHYGPDNGNGMALPPYLFYTLQNGPMIQFRVVFQNYVAKEFQIVLRDQSDGGADIQLNHKSYEIDKIDLFSNAQPNQALRQLYDDYLIYKTEVPKFKNLLKFFVNQMKINVDLVDGDKAFGLGEGGQNNKEFGEKYKSWTSYREGELAIKLWKDIKVAPKKNQILFQDRKGNPEFINIAPTDEKIESLELRKYGHTESYGEFTVLDLMLNDEGISNQLVTLYSKLMEAQAAISESGQKQMSKEELETILNFFVLVAQKKILTRVDYGKSSATNYYADDHRYNTSNNVLSLHKPEWASNIEAYISEGVDRSWFDTGLECIHFLNGSAQNQNYGYRNSSIHFSNDHKYAVEFMPDAGDTRGDNLIVKLEARVFRVYDENNNHTNKDNSYVSKLGDQVQFELPVTVLQEDSGKIAEMEVDLTDENYSKFLELMNNLEVYFDEFEKKQEGSKLPSKGWNRILYGPPGTGKTYSINKYKEELIHGQTLAHSIVNFDSLTWKETILLAMKWEEYPSLKVKEISSLELLEQYANTKSSKNAHQTISTTILNNADEKSTTVSSRNGLDLFTKDEYDNWSVTENGKNAADEAESHITEEQMSDEDFFVKIVTFHQSYGYEDFIEGINAETEDGKISYQVKDGVFKRFCNDAKQNPDQNFLFVIDEINRGNISKIFGELITLIEPSKRIGASESLSVVLPYSGDIFGVPQNVYILGTMNTADRSIAMMDTALRRRFDFIEKMPDPGVVRKEVGQIDGIDVASLLEIMNRRIEFLYDREHTLGHAFFLNIGTIGELKAVFENKIIPLLQEYFYEDYEKIQAVLNDTQQIYIVQVNDDSTLFSNAFNELKSDNDEIKFEVAKNVSDADFIQFAKNITKVGD